MYIPFRKLQHQLKKKLDSDYRRKNKKKNWIMILTLRIDL